MSQPDHQDPVTRLKRIDASAVSDALDKLQLTGSVPGLQQLATQQRLAGRIVTYRLVAKEDAPPPSDPPRHLGTTAVEAAEPGDVIVVEQRTGIEAGSWGGILSLGAKLRGVGGVISDGLIRDIDEAKAYEFPVYGRGTTVRTARNRVVEEATNIPITVGDISVAPGDYVIADGSGVVFIQQAHIDEVLNTAEDIAGREAAMAKALMAGQPISAVMGGAYEHMLNR